MNANKKLTILSSCATLILSLLGALPFAAHAEDKDIGVRYCTWVHPRWQQGTLIPGHQNCSTKQYKQGDWVWSPGHWHQRPRFNDRVWVSGHWVRP
ncbi:hypothetical protein BH10PSE19_BH10PSE19_17960 [soil metagenome]